MTNLIVNTQLKLCSEDNTLFYERREHALSYYITSFLLLQIDESPLDGKSFDRETLEQLSKEGVTLVSYNIEYSFHGLEVKCFKFCRRLQL